MSPERLSRPNTPETANKSTQLQPLIDAIKDSKGEFDLGDFVDANNRQDKLNHRKAIRASDTQEYKEAAKQLNESDSNNLLQSIVAYFKKEGVFTAYYEGDSTIPKAGLQFIRLTGSQAAVLSVMSGLLLGKTLYKATATELANKTIKKRFEDKQRDLDGDSAYDQIFLYDLVYGCVETKLCITNRCIQYNHEHKNFDQTPLLAPVISDPVVPTKITDDISPLESKPKSYEPIVTNIKPPKVTIQNLESQAVTLEEEISKEEISKEETLQTPLTKIIFDSSPIEKESIMHMSFKETIKNNATKNLEEKHIIITSYFEIIEQYMNNKITYENITELMQKTGGKINKSLGKGTRAGGFLVKLQKSNSEGYDNIIKIITASEGIIQLGGYNDESFVSSMLSYYKPKQGENNNPQLNETTLTAPNKQQISNDMNKEKTTITNPKAIKGIVEGSTNVGDIDSNNIIEKEGKRKLIEVFGDRQETEASHYGEKSNGKADRFHGKLTANGEKFDKDNPTTAAHKTLPMNTIVEVQDPNTGKSIRVRINDRGPYVKDRGLDLSSAAFKQLFGDLTQGVGEVQYRIVTKELEPLDDVMLDEIVVTAPKIETPKKKNPLINVNQPQGVTTAQLDNNIKKMTELSEINDIITLKSNIKIGDKLLTEGKYREAANYYLDEIDGLEKTNTKSNDTLSPYDAIAKRITLCYTEQGDISEALYEMMMNDLVPRQPGPITNQLSQYIMDLFPDKRSDILSRQTSAHTFSN